MRGEISLYHNLIQAMKKEKVTFSQIGELLNCRYQTVSDVVNGVTKKGFYFEDACKIQKTLFPQYDMHYLLRKKAN